MAKEILLLNRRIKLYDEDQCSEVLGKPRLIIMPGTKFERIEIDGKPQFRHIDSGMVLSAAEGWFDKDTYREG